MPKDAIRWFEIPALDIHRAVKFYNVVLGYSMAPFDMHNCTMAMFPCEPGQGVGGAVTKQADFQPSQQGTLVYLECGDDLALALAKVEPAGGKVLMPKTAIGQHGYIALFLDTEGNKVGLHSMA
jgi:predicted enzyme related to lactoylglutathione lyase